ncbi:MAG: hypothetical protein KDI07_01355 [Anaerolineae bacterium]|nr:hypothetical protein [Anaerolineae bacterium]MCB9131276.1 hypothetical protein [Anaerolineales bacterium]MCB0229564.1 hypothetical protein [Anaerolineae bacterium]MCB0233380.1 hypothetical protein [Anaerolineae bacterium]MCB0237037.1 hypothetical protein [Anaerolineae bacterium]
MTFNFAQAFDLFGAGMLAVAGLFVWFAGSIARRRDQTEDGVGGCMLALIVLAFMIGCVFLLWKAFA